MSINTSNSNKSPKNPSLKVLNNEINNYYKIVTGVAAVKDASNSEFPSLRQTAATVGGRQQNSHPLNILYLNCMGLANEERMYLLESEISKIK